MRKQKKLPSRRKRALRRCALLLLALALAGVTGVYEFVPARGIRSLADRVGVEEPRVVTWFYDPAIPNSRSGIHMLVDGDRAMMLCYSGFSLSRGWEGGAWTAAQTWDGSGLYGGVYAHWQGDDRLGYVFGKITDPDICRVTLRCGTRGEELATMDVPETAVFAAEDGGARYFLAPLTEKVMEASKYHTEQHFLTGEAEDGGEVLTVEIRARHWASAGDF